MRRMLIAISVSVGIVGTSGLLGVPVAAAGGGCHAPVSFGEGVTQVISDHACWSPVVAQVAVGDTLAFVNDGSADHTLNGLGPIGSHDFRTGATVRLTFPEAGIFPYACALHPQMVGAVVVGDPLRSAGAPAEAAVAPPVDLTSAAAEGDSALLGSRAAQVGSGAALAAGLGAGLVVLRRRRTGRDVVTNAAQTV
ncbi:MAG TPA: hypothetical protein VNB94_11030 [Mycobacteriales bacterium]|nr:hypothetical protein [Mycobacteriales bacterium]